MNPDPSAAPNLPTLLGFAALLAFSFYRRVRRNIGEQPIRPRRMMLRIGLLTLIGGFLMFARAAQLPGQLSELGGFAGGAALGVLGVRLTRFHRTAAGDFYTPNPWLGTAVSLLFIGRIVYRVLTLPGGLAGFTRMDPALFYGNAKGFATLALFGVVVGYYVVYSAGVLWMHRRQRWPQAMDAAVDPGAVAPPDGPPPSAATRMGGSL